MILRANREHLSQERTQINLLWERKFVQAMTRLFRENEFDRYLNCLNKVHQKGYQGYQG